MSYWGRDSSDMLIELARPRSRDSVYPGWKNRLWLPQRA